MQGEHKIACRKGGGAEYKELWVQAHQLNVADDARRKERAQARSGCGGGGGGRHRIHRSVAKAWTHHACIAAVGDPAEVARVSGS